MGRRRHKPVYAVSSHDGPQWFRVGQVPGQEGWFVIRTCPCHNGKVMSRPYATPERAGEALDSLTESKHVRTDKRASQDAEQGYSQDHDDQHHHGAGYLNVKSPHGPPR